MRLRNVKGSREAIQESIYEYTKKRRVQEAGMTYSETIIRFI